jgi:hypothetical protein
MGNNGYCMSLTGIVRKALSDPDAVGIRFMEMNAGMKIYLIRKWAPKYYSDLRAIPTAIRHFFW